VPLALLGLWFNGFCLLEDELMLSTEDLRLCSPNYAEDINIFNI